MIIAQVEPGICGFSALIRVSKVDRKSINIKIESDCEHIQAFAAQLPLLGMREILKTPINKNPVYETAGRCHLHASCAVPCGVIKASEIALGLALLREVNIKFQDDD